MTHQQIALQEMTFEGGRVATFEVEDRPFVAMRRIVENLGLSWATQRNKLNGQSGKFNCVHMNTVADDGKPRNMLSMPVDKLPLWLATINPNKIKDADKRAKIELYQEKCAKALHDFWNKGIAVRDDLEGVVTSLDPQVMQALGGMMKAVLNKGLSEMLPLLVEAKLADREMGIVRGVTAHDVIVMAGVEDRKGLRGLGNFVSRRLRRDHAKKGIAVKLKDVYGDVSVLVYDKATSKEWLTDGGKETIWKYVEERRGQPKLRLVASTG